MDGPELRPQRAVRRTKQRGVATRAARKSAEGGNERALMSRAADP